MRTRQELSHARKVIRDACLTPGLSDAQLLMFMGMLNAILWAAGAKNCSTMERLLNGEPIAPGLEQDVRKSLENLRVTLASMTKVEEDAT